jgi:hypothetical protein
MSGHLSVAEPEEQQLPAEGPEGGAGTLATLVSMVALQVAAEAVLVRQTRHRETLATDRLYFQDSSHTLQASVPSS